MTLDHLATAPTAERESAVVSVDTPAGGPVTVTMIGEFDLLGVETLSRALDRALIGDQDIVVDLAGVTFMFSGAYSVIADAADRAPAGFRVHAPTRAARMLFELNGFVTDERAA